MGFVICQTSHTNKNAVFSNVSLVLNNDWDSYLISRMCKNITVGACVENYCLLLGSVCVEANYPTDSLLKKTKETQHVLFFVILPSTGHENNAPHPKTGKCSRDASHFHSLTVV